MTRLTNWKEALGIFAVVAMLVALPLGLRYWRTSMVPHRYPPGTKIINLTAIADGGIWTQEEIVGYNYWWRKPVRTEKILLNQGDHVVVLLHSVDVLHSFAIPLLHVGPVEVAAGHTVEVAFDANRAGELTFLCLQVCSPDHSKLQGDFLVKGNEKEESW
jgi:heme/copper-type cytochrome/quinol oxidase subunit 2